MTTLTVEFKGMTERILVRLIELGYAKTKSEALRYALLRVGKELEIMTPSFHQRTAMYMEDELVKRFARLRR